mgnify:FL=1
MSGKMAAILGFIVGEQWATPHIMSLSITSDGFLIGRDSSSIDEYGLGRSVFVGAANDLAANLCRLFEVADLTPDELATFECLKRQQIKDWRC